MYNFTIKENKENNDKIERYFNDFKNNVVKLFETYGMYESSNGSIDYEQAILFLRELKELIKFYKKENQKYKDCLTFDKPCIQTISQYITFSFGYFFTLKIVDFLSHLKIEEFLPYLEVDIEKVVCSRFFDIVANYQEMLINEDASCTKGAN